MSGFQGGCDAFEKLVNAPHVECCISCESDEEAGYPIAEVCNNMDGPWPNLPADAWFSICCAHLDAYKESKPAGRIAEGK